MTPSPKSLLQIAGAPAAPAPLDAAVLVIIDAQREYTEGNLPLHGVEAAVAEAAALLRLARAEGVPVIHVIQHAAPGGPLFDPATRFAEIVPELRPAPGEEVVAKALPNAFAGTALEAKLRAVAGATGRRELILAGFMTHMCVSATARAALDLGFRSTIVAAATATRALPDPLGGIVPAETVHRTALAELADRFAIVVPDVACLEAVAAKAA
ncbi:MAG TPA: cysteine hydrolase family protein [Microvirga sp.]|nr:cysteine hydrolase family protein [Microvirga sp.]